MHTCYICICRHICKYVSIHVYISLECQYQRQYQYKSIGNYNINTISPVADGPARWQALGWPTTCGRGQGRAGGDCIYLIWETS